MYSLALYLATDGLMGECPDDYALIKAANYLNCKPWELMEESMWWRVRALKFITAEARSAEMRRQRGQ